MKRTFSQRLPSGKTKEHETDLSVSSYRRGQWESGLNLTGELHLLLHRGKFDLIVKRDSETVLLKPDELLILSGPGKLTFNAKNKVQDLFLISYKKDALELAIKENKLPVEDKKRLSQGLFLKPTLSPWLRALLKQFFYESIMMLETPNGCSFFLEKQIVNEVIRCVFSNYYLKDASLSNPMDIKVHEVVMYIETNLNHEQLNISDISRDAGMSESSLLRKFKDSIGTTPYNYIKKRRMENAYDLIKDGQASVSEACYLVGYSDFASFTKTFKSFHGILPSKLKQEVR